MRCSIVVEALLVLTLCGLPAAGCGGASPGPDTATTAGSPKKKPLKKRDPANRAKELDKRFGTVQEISAGESRVTFVDVTKERGIGFIQDGGMSDEHYSIEMIAAGVAFFDADGDGDQDLYLLNGTHIAPPARTPPPVNGFYLNDGTGHFKDATESSGLGDKRFSVGVCAADFDNDGDQDVYVTNWDDASGFYRNDGMGHFSDIAKAAGVEGHGATVSSCAWGDVDGDGLVDLYVGYYSNNSKKNNKVCEDPLRDGSGMKRRYCTPKDYEPLPDILFRNRGDGTFQDISQSSGITKWVGRTLSECFSDFDDDGDLDLFVASDRTANGYFVNDGKGHFREMGMENNLALSDEGKAQAGMGSTAGDFDEDGRIDLAATYFEREANGVYRNLGNHQFQDITVESGTARASLFLLAWGTEFFDADLDSHLDWMVVNGHAMPDVELFREPVAGFAQPKLFFLGRGDGTFENLATTAGPAMKTERVSRGFATADIDGDGDLDAVVGNINAAPELLLNDSKRDGLHWLMARLIGSKSNRDGIGARLTLHLGDRKLVREVKTGQSCLSQSALPVHWGLGKDDLVPLLEIRWPSGATSRLENIQADQLIEIREP